MSKSSNQTIMHQLQQQQQAKATSAIAAQLAATAAAVAAAAAGGPSNNTMQQQPTSTTMQQQQQPQQLQQQQQQTPKSVQAAQKQIKQQQQQQNQQTTTISTLLPTGQLQVSASGGGTYQATQYQPQPGSIVQMQAQSLQQHQQQSQQQSASLRALVGQNPQPLPNAITLNPIGTTTTTSSGQQTISSIMAASGMYLSCITSILSFINPFYLSDRLSNPSNHSTAAAKRTTTASASPTTATADTADSNKWPSIRIWRIATAATTDTILYDGTSDDRHNRTGLAASG